MKHVRRFCIALIAFAAFLAVLCGPAATHLQSRQTWADPADDWDAVYLVCGARAQDRRITALCRWIQRHTEIRSQKSEIGSQHPETSPILSPHPTSHLPPPTILIGNDPQISLWCRKHQTNHTRSGWALEKLRSEIGGQRSEVKGLPSPPLMDTRIPATPVDESPNNFAPNHFALSQQSTSSDPSCSIPSRSPLQSSAPRPPTSVVPGNFHNTDGEMAALAAYLKAHPEIHSIALATSRFHSRRLLQRYQKHTGNHPNVGIIPGIAHWENRAPWIVLGEYLKMLRDRLGLTSHLTRSGREKAK